MQTLDAMALATLDEGVLIPKLAARFRREFNHLDDPDESLTVDTANFWVNRNFGPLFTPGEEARLGWALVSEIKLQSMISKRRQKARELEGDELGSRRTLPLWGRRARLVKEILGPADRHLSPKLNAKRGMGYADHRISKGLVLALITGNELTKERDLLVFRAPGSRRVQTWWVGNCLGLDRALDWLITPAVSALHDKGCRVEREWHKTRWRISYPNGRVVYLPWRKR